MTKARDISKIIDGDGNLVSNNAGTNARDLGIVKSDGDKLSSLDKSTTEATVINTTTPYAGIIPTNNCSGATGSSVDSSFNTNTTYVDADGNTVNHTVDLKKPPNGNWWTWSGLGFTGVPTTNCANQGAYDGAGGNTSSFQAVTVSSIFSDYTDTEELGGTYRVRSVQNCNCGSFNCRTNCNCNCACACDCACSTDSQA